MAGQSTGKGWTFLSNHTHVLVCLAADGEQTLRDVAAKVGLTERGVQRIVAELEQAGVLERDRDGRRNLYRIDAKAPLRHPLEAHCQIGALLQLVTPASGLTTKTQIRSTARTTRRTLAN